MISMFTRHPASVGETYGQHMAMAGSFGFRLIAVGAACLIHAALPFLFEKTASRMVERLHAEMVTGRVRRTRGDVAHTQT